MDILFKVCGQSLYQENSFQKVVADSRNYLRAGFAFSPDWEGAAKTAVFTGRDKTYHVLLEEDRCMVPAEVIRAPGFTVSVFGGDLITANSVKVPVTASGYQEGGPPADPTPDLYSQIVSQLARKADGLRYENGLLQLLSQGVPVGNQVEISSEGGGGGGRVLYLQRFAAGDWTDRRVKQELLLPAQIHGLGYGAVVAELTRQDETGNLENVLCQVQQLPNGDFSIQSSEAFAGRIILEGV